jgi:hypothetical protein
MDIGGVEGCQSLFEQLGFQAASDPQMAAIHWMVVDVYAMQHVERYGLSAKSYAAHLMGLCCGIEHGANPTIYRAIPRWLNGKVDLVKPPILTERGTITIKDIVAEQDLSARIQRIHEWAADVWAAYASQHEIARRWLNLALEHPRKA